MEFEAVAARVRHLPGPHISPQQGRVLYDHLRATKPETVLELGTAHGVSAAYIAAALDANGHGRLTTVDSSVFALAWQNPAPEEVLAFAGLRDWVSFERSYSTYTWFLKEQIERRSDRSGNCEPLYDFCFLDGQKNWTVDGLAVFLIEKLLRPGGWLLMDDLAWTYSPDRQGRHYTIDIGSLSEKERREPHMRAVFELIVKQHPAFTELRIQDANWGWAQKQPDQPRRLTIDTTRSLSSIVLAGMRAVKRELDERLARRGSR
jgi:predicted O-methyltransferase YrrM